MRNLKKFLALALALMMVLSTMAFASATTFTDDATITEKYAEAVGVLSGIGVISGFENADGTFTFNPTGTLTRAQAAKIVAYAKQGNLDNIDILADGVNLTFTDVPDWAKSCVAYMYSEGIISGRNATTFDPNGAITGFELGKMLLVACGFMTGEDFTAASNWKIAVSEGLKAAGAWVGTDFLLSKELTREEACYLTFNMMNASPAGTTTTYVVANKTFTDIVEAYNYCQALNAISGGSYTVATNELPTDSLLATVFPTVTKTAALGLGADEFGRPEAIKWSIGDNVVYKTYEAPLAVVTTGVDVTKTAKNETWYGWTFPSTNNTVIYNGSVYQADFANSLKAAGMTVELYGTVAANGTKIVDTIVAYDYYFATITDIASNGNISLEVREAGYMVGHPTAPFTVEISATKTNNKHSDDYLALSGYAKGDVLALCVQQGFEDDTAVAAWGSNILDVKVPTATEGTVTSTTIKLNGSTPVYSQSSITFNGTKYTFANQYARQELEVGAQGTLYTLNGLVIGFVAKSAPAASTDTIFVVDHFTVFTKGDSYWFDEWGVYHPGTASYYTAWVQGITMSGEQVTYPVKKLTSTGSEDAAAEIETSEFTNKEGTILKYTKGTDGHYTSSSASNTMATSVANIDADKISFADGGNKYYYNNAEVILVEGSLGELSIKAGKLADVENYSKVYVVFGATTSTNKTVSKIFCWTDEVDIQPVYENVFVNVGLTTVPTKVIASYDEDGNAIYGYVYDVLVGGDVMSVTIGEGVVFGLGYYEYYFEDGLHVVELLDETDGVRKAVVTNVYGNYITVAGLTDHDITGVQIVDLTVSATTGDKLGNGIVDANESVWFMLGGSEAAGYTIETIYIVPAAYVPGI